MTEFNALLRRSFAEAPEPADDGFSVQVTAAVAHREKALKVRSLAQNVGMAAGFAAAAYGLYTVAGPFGQDLLAAAGLEVARIHAAVTEVPSVGGLAETAGQGLMRSLGAGMTQILLMTTAAIAGGAVVYRAVQE